MADSKNKDISYIENYVSKMLTKHGVSDNICVSTPPAALDSSWEDFAVIEVDRQRDLDAYAYGYVNVYLYAKPTGSNLSKNVKRLREMEIALREAVNNYHDANYRSTIWYREQDYDSTRNFHYDVIILKVISK